MVSEIPVRSDLLMAHRVLAESAVTISEHKQNPMATLPAGDCMPVAVAQPHRAGLLLLADQGL